MNKLLIFGVFLIFTLGAYIYISGFFYIENPSNEFDNNFERVSKEVEEYGGAMIVKYDTETGEIISKRPANQAGVLSITEEEYLKNPSGFPTGTKVISKNLSPSQAVTSK